jgi:hypothetical protein
MLLSKAVLAGQLRMASWLTARGYNVSDSELRLCLDTAIQFNEREQIDWLLTNVSRCKFHGRNVNASNCEVQVVSYAVTLTNNDLNTAVAYNQLGCAKVCTRCDFKLMPPALAA